MAEYIERGALITRLQKVCVTDDIFGMGLQYGTENAINCIKEQPTADVVEVRYGKWLTWEEQFPDRKPTKKNNLGVFCNNCHSHADNMTDYCPNCGARMKKT